MIIILNSIIFTQRSNIDRSFIDNYVQFTVEYGEPLYGMGLKRILLCIGKEESATRSCTGLVYVYNIDIYTLTQYLQVNTVRLSER